MQRNRREGNSFYPLLLEMLSSILGNSSFCIASILLLLMLSSPVSAWAVPEKPAKYIMVVHRLSNALPWIDISEDEYRYSDSGYFFRPEDDSDSLLRIGIGLGGNDLGNHQEETQTYTLYVRSDIAKESVEVTKSNEGLIELVPSPDYYNYYTSACDLQTYFREDDSGNDWNDHYPPEELPALVSFANPNGNFLPFSLYHDYTLTPDVENSQTFPDLWPDVVYYPLIGETLKDRAVAEYVCPADTIFSDVGGIISSDTAFHIFGAPDIYKPKPGNEPGPNKKLRCKNRRAGLDKQFSASLNLATANVHVSADDPVKTRGYPLNNRIHLNSQAVELNRGMGNATFTYDMHLVLGEIIRAVDGDGQRIAFGGPDSIGVYSSLDETTEGYRLSGAGAPENIRSAGNYVYDFDSSGILTAITDPSGNIQSLGYIDGKLSQVEDLSSGKILTFGWTDERITSVVENGGARTIITYTDDEAKFVESLSMQDGSANVAKSMAFTYWDGELSSFELDGEPSTTQYLSYDHVSGIGEEGEVNVPLAAVEGADGSSTIPEYHDTSPVSGADLRHIVSDGEGRKTYYDFDGYFNPIRIANDSNVTTMTYSLDKMTSWSDGATTLTYEYEGDRLTKIIRPDETFTQYNWNEELTDLMSIEDSIGTIAEFTYGNSSLPHTITAVADGSGNTWEINTNAFGQITEVVPPTGSQIGTTTFDYDENSSSPSFGWLKTITDGEGNELRVEDYNELGDPLAISTDPDPTSPTTRITESRTFDSARRVLSLIHADSTSFNFHYSGRDLSWTEDEAGIETEFEYCPSCGALEHEGGPLSHDLLWERNADRQLSSFTDARLNVTNYAYDGSGRLSQILFPDGNEFAYEYDSAGRLEYLHGGNGIFQFSFDVVGRTEAVTPSENDPIRNYTYFADDRLDTASTPEGAVSYEYYPNRLVQAVIYNYSNNNNPTPQRVEYEYWPDNLVKKVTWKNGTATVATWEYAYDAAGRLTSVSSFGDSINYTYDGQGKVLTQTNGNGTSTSYAWNDARGWPTSITHKAGSTIFSSYALTYDSGDNTIGNLTGVEEYSGDTMTYGYDALYRLTSESRSGIAAYSRTYDYDLAGNLTSLNESTFATYDEGNKISALSGTDYINNGPGYVSEISTSTISSSFNYDFLTQLSDVGDIQYFYDAFGRRVMQQGGTGNTTGGPRIFIYDGSRLLGELEVEFGEEEDVYVPKVAYTWGSDGLVSERLFGAGSGGSDVSLWYHFGPQGETRELTNASGTVVDTYRYDAYGIPLSSSGSDFNSHKYGGKFGYYSNMPVANLILAGARWYSPDLRRWMSRDPIQYAGGENLYAYVKDNPLKFVDPSGLDLIKNNAGYPIVVSGDPGAGNGEGGDQYSVVPPDGKVYGGNNPLDSFNSPEDAMSNYRNPSKGIKPAGKLHDIDNYSCGGDMERIHGDDIGPTLTLGDDREGNPIVTGREGDLGAIIRSLPREVEKILGLL